MQAELTSVRCPQCGGQATLPSGRRLVRCGFCDSTLYVDRSGVVSRYALPRLIGEEAAAAALKRWMSGNETVKDLDRKSSIVSASAVSFPMWLFRIVGEAGEEAMVEPAAATPIAQLTDLKIPAGKMEVYDPAADSKAEEVEPTVPLETARTWMEQREAGDIVETAMVQVPLWRCEYTYAGRSYSALVEGSTGSVMVAQYPEKRESPYFLVAGLGIVLFGLEGLVLTDPFLKLVAFAVTAVPLIMIAYWVAKKV